LKVVALAGGTGSAKLLRGLASLDLELTVIANVGDNIWVHGLYVCPDIDTALYTLAGVANRTHGWGVEGDTFNTLRQLRELGQETWFALGDKDLATHLMRTRALREGKTLTEATREACAARQLRARILPATDSELETRILTPEREMNLQEFWVRKGGRPRVNGVKYVGAEEARLTGDVEGAIGQADAVVVCPANPISSIGPMLAIPGMREALASARAKTSAVSPMVGARPFSGPAAKLMRASGTSPDSVGVAGLYVDFLDAIIIDKRDRRMAEEINRLGVRCHLFDTEMTSSAAERRLAKELLES
jgi:LPPG:FO 2-phospho-L-lactate transferase